MSNGKGMAPTKGYNNRKYREQYDAIFRPVGQPVRGTRKSAKGKRKVKTTYGTRVDNPEGTFLIHCI